MGRQPKPKQKYTIPQEDLIASLSTGETQLSLAKRYGISQPTVSHLAARVKDQIKAAQLRLINEGVDKAIENQLTKIRIGKDLIASATNPGDAKYSKGQVIPGVDNAITLQLADKVEERVLKMAGILPAQASIVLQQLFLSSQSTVFLSPAVSQALKGFSTQLQDHDVIDVTDESDDE